MTQLTFGDLKYSGKRKCTRREIFLAEMEQVVPWQELLALIEPHYQKAGRGRRPYPLTSMLRNHLMQNWFGLSDPGMEEALYEIVPMRQFAQLPLTGALPDDTTVLNFHRLLETHALAPKREWHIAEKRGQVKAMEEGPLKEVTQELETLKARYRARVEHPFHVVKCQFAFQKVRFKGLVKNTAQVITLFALSNLWMARRRSLTMTG